MAAGQVGQDPAGLVEADLPAAADHVVSSPSLTTVAAPLDLLGRAAVETPLAQTSRRWAVAARSAMLPADLVVRGSTGPRGARPALSTAV